MKTFALLFAALCATASAEDCDYAVVGPQLHTLGDEIATCVAATGYDVVQPTEPPTDEQASNMCSKCGDFVDKVSGMTWPDCEMDLAGKKQTLTAYFDSIVGHCLVDSDSKEEAGTPVTNSSAGDAAGSSVNDDDDDSSDATPAPSTAAQASLAFAATALAACSVAAMNV